MIPGGGDQRGAGRLPSAYREAVKRDNSNEEKPSPTFVGEGLFSSN